MPWGVQATGSTIRGTGTNTGAAIESVCAGGLPMHAAPGRGIGVGVEVF